MRVKVCSAFCVLFVLHAVDAAAQDWRWLSHYDIAMGQLTSLFVERGPSGIALPSVLALGRENAYLGNGQRTDALLTASEFDRMESRSRLFGFPEGTILLAGASVDLRAYGVYRLEKTSQGQTYRLVDVKGQNFGGGFASGDMTVLDNTSMRLGNAYSFDTGNTWYGMVDPPDGLSLRTARMIGQRGVFVHRSNPEEWWKVDTAARQYVRAPDLDPTVCHIAELGNGSAMAIRCSAGDEVNLVVRPSPSAPWEVVPPLEAENGTLIDPRRHVYPNGHWLFATQVGTALFILDSGRAVEYNGTTLRLRLFDNDRISGRLRSVESIRPRTPDVIRAVYEIGRGIRRTVTIVDVSTVHGNVVAIRRGLRAVPEDVNESGYLSRGPHYTSWTSGITRPALRLGDDDASLREQQYLRQVVACGKTAVTLGTTGEQYVLDSLHLLPMVHSQTVPQVGSINFLEQLRTRASMFVIDDSTWMVPTTVPRLARTSGRTDTLPMLSNVTQAPVITCCTKDAAGRLVVAGNVIARLNGTVWDTIPYPDVLRDSAVVISSLVFRAADTIIVAGRGYGIGSSVLDGFRYRRGGIVMSTDGGATWSQRALPRQEEWVENLTTGPDGALYCWATSMVFDAAYTQPANPMGRYGSARLYRSPDGGMTWTEFYVDEADEEQRRQAVDHQWSISFLGTNALAISTPTGIFISRGIGLQFQAIEDLPLTATFGGCALDSEGMLWVSSSQGLHRRSPWTSAVNEGKGTRASLRVIPQPVTDVCTLELQAADESWGLPEFVTLTSLDGSTSCIVMRHGTRYQTSTQTLAPGVYVAHARTGENSISTMVVIQR